MAPTGEMTAGAGGFIDLHTHILPDLDDGARGWDEALAMAELAASSGTAGLFLTPHWLEGGYAPSPQEVIEAAGAFCERLSQRGLQLKVWPGMEVYLSPEVPRALSAGKLLTLADAGTHLLVELPFAAWPPYAEQVVFELQLVGITPVIAHPERCQPAAADPRRLCALVERGALVQLNAGSLTGRFGRRAQDFAWHLISCGCAHFVGSDAHNPSDRAPGLLEAARALRGALGDEGAGLLLRQNAENLLSGRPVQPPRVSCELPSGGVETARGARKGLARLWGFWGSKQAF